MKRLVTKLGAQTLKQLVGLGRGAVLVAQSLNHLPRHARDVRALLSQTHVLGVQSVVIVISSAFFIGMVMGLQGYHTLSQFGAVSQLGPLVALSVFRELGPVVTALLFAGRAGSALTSELGLMQVTEQIDSMEVMAVDPLRHVLFPRVVAGVCVVPALTVLFNAVALLGGYGVAVVWLGLDAGMFWANMQAAVNWHADVVSGLLKSVVFGCVIVAVAVAQGFFAERSAEGIGRAATRTVVLSSVAVLAADFVLTSFLIGVGW